MSKTNGQLSANPNSAKCPLNVRQETRGDTQPTYIIIYKQKETSDTLNTNLTDGNDTTNDIVRRNLADIDVDSYDSSFSTAKIFLDEENENCDTVTHCRKLRTISDTNDSNLIKRNLFQNSFSPVTSTCNTFTSVHSKITSVVTPGNCNEQDSGVFCTPTSVENLKNHSAVRKIVLISPDLQTPQRVQSISGQAFQGCTSSPKVSPDFSVPHFPLATSTPVTAADGCHNVTYTPDSGVSLTASFTCSTPGTPAGTSVVNLSTASNSSVSSGFGHLQVSEKLSDNGETRCQISQPDLETVNIHVPGTVNEEQEDACLNTSLANIHWLKGYSLPKKKPAAKAAAKQGMGIRWVPENHPKMIGSDQGEIKRNEQESGQCQRPPYSYMTLIQMALRSREDKKMTLKEICSWVECTFPFYKNTAKAGWKNSIRHNLSFYQCFVRDQAEKKKHGAHWTLQFDEADNEQTTDKSTDVYVSQPMTANEVPGMIPLFVNSPFLQPPNSSLQSFQPDSLTSRKRRTGPMPILPRPSPMQAYALVPIQSVPLQAMQNNPIIVHVPHSLPQQQAVSNLAPVVTSIHSNFNQTQAITLASSSTNSVHSSCHSPATLVLPQLNSVYTQSQNMTKITVSPKECSIETSTTNYSKIHLSSKQAVKQEYVPGQQDSNVIKQAWLQAEELAVESQAPFFQTSPHHMNSCEQIIDPLVGFHNEAFEQKSKRQKTNGGLPKPKMYMTHPKKRTRSRIKKHLPKVLEEKELLAESSDSESENKMFSGLPTPLRLLLDSDSGNNSEPHITSTPLRNVSFSPDQLPSPIRGLTPLKCGNLFDGSFLDNLHEEAARTIKMFSSPLNCDTLKGGNSSFSEYGIIQISPDRSLKGGNDSDNKHNLSTLLADFPIDANFLDDGDGLPVDFSVLNWSNLQQQCLNKSSSPSDS